MITAIILGVAIYWVTSFLMKVPSKGLILNTLFVILGSYVGNWAIRAMGFYQGGGFLSSLIAGVFGCCIVLFVSRLLQDKF